MVRNDTVHLFYQTYGNGAKDAICHAWSEDGIHFVRNATNPIFLRKGVELRACHRCGGRFLKDRYYLYYATRTPDYSTQIIGVAMAPAHTDFRNRHGRVR